MTDNSAPGPGVEVVLAGEVTVDTLLPLRQCLKTLLGGTGSYLIRAGEVTRIEADTAEVLLGLLRDLERHGATVRWAAASRVLISAARGLASDRRDGLSSAIPV